MIEVFLLSCCLVCLIVSTVVCIRMDINIWYLCKYIRSIENRLGNIDNRLYNISNRISNTDAEKKVISLLRSINNKLNNNGTKKSTKCDKGQ